MPKITIHKVTADGEQIVVEVAGSDKLDLEKLVRPTLDLLDARLLEMNRRVIASNVMYKKLAPDAQNALTNVLDVLHGRSQGPAPVEIIEQAKLEAEQERIRLLTEAQASDAGLRTGLLEIPGGVEEP